MSYDPKNPADALRRISLAMYLALCGCESALDLSVPDADASVDRPDAREVWLPPEDAAVDESLLDPFDDLATSPPPDGRREVRCDGQNDPDDPDDAGVDEGCPYEARSCDACAPPPAPPSTFRFRVARAAAMGGGLALGVWREGFMQEDNRMMFALARLDGSGLTPVSNGFLHTGPDPTQPAAFASVARLSDRFLVLWAPPARRCAAEPCMAEVALVTDAGDVLRPPSLALEGPVTSNLVAWDRGAVFGAVATSTGSALLHRLDADGREVGTPRALDLGASGPVRDLRAVAWRGRIAWVFAHAEGRALPVSLVLTDAEGRREGDPVQLLPWGAFLPETQGGAMVVGGSVVVTATVPAHGLMLTAWSPEAGVQPAVLVASESAILATTADGASVFVCSCTSLVSCAVRRLSPRGARLGPDVALPTGWQECELSADHGRALVALGDYGRRVNPYLILVAPEGP